MIALSARKGRNRACMIHSMLAQPHPSFSFTVFFFTSRFISCRHSWIYTTQFVDQYADKREAHRDKAHTTSGYLLIMIKTFLSQYMYIYICHAILWGAHYVLVRNMRTENQPLTLFIPFSSDFRSVPRYRSLSGSVSALQYVWHIVIYEPTSA